MSAKAPAPASAAAAPVPAASTASTTTTAKTKKTTKSKKKTKRKKTTSSSSTARNAASSAASATAIWNAAHAAQAELSQQKANAAARKSDPLWYRVEEPVQSVAGETAMASSGSLSGVLTNQVELVEAALLNHNLTRVDVTPQAFACLLEQARRYGLELYADAQDYAYAANRHEVSRADLLLAAELRPSTSNMSLATLQPRLSHLAQQINRVPLPPIPANCYHGIVLPPKEHQLTARTFDVVSGARTAQRMVAPPPALPAKKATKKTKNINKTSYGAKRGQQIPIQLKESTAATVSGPTPMDVVPTPGAPAPIGTSGVAPTSKVGVVGPPAGTAPVVAPQAGTAPPTTATGTGAQHAAQALPGADGGTKRKADQL